MSSNNFLHLGALLLSVGEIFITFTHGEVFFRTNLMTYEELRGHWAYFVVDLLTALGSYVILELLTRRKRLTPTHKWLLPFVVVHSLLHLFYLLTWEDGYFSQRIQHWSSSEYSLAGPWITWDWALTLYDLGLHSTMIYYLDKILQI